MKAAARALFFDDSSLYGKRLFVKETEKSNDLFLLYNKHRNEIVIKENRTVIIAINTDLKLQETTTDWASG